MTGHSRALNRSYHHRAAASDCAVARFYIRLSKAVATWAHAKTAIAALRNSPQAQDMLIDSKRRALLDLANTKSNRRRVSYRAWPALPQSDALCRRHAHRRARIRHCPGHASRAGAQAAVKAYIFSMQNVLRSSEFTPLPISAAAYHTGPGPHCPDQMRSADGTRSAAPEYGIAPVTHRAPGHQTAVKAYIYSMPNMLRSSEFTPLPISAAAYHTGPGPHCPNQMRSVTGTHSAAPEYGVAPVTHRAPGHKQPSKRISFLCKTCSGPANSRPCPSAPLRIIPGLARIALIRCALPTARAAPRPNMALPRSRIARRGTKQPSKRISILCQTCSGPANSRPCPSAPPRICPTAPGASLDPRHPA